MTYPRFTKHVLELVKDYDQITLINLISKAKKEEDALSQSMTKLLDVAVSENSEVKLNVNYVYFDFHYETKGDNFYKINDLLN